MRELLTKEKKRKINDHMIGTKRAAKCARCVAVFLGEAK